MVLINGVEFIFEQNIITKTDILLLLNLPQDEFYLLSNGKIITEVQNVKKCSLNLILRVNGGKGGFGSMLRAIGAQIEKTTNREACRDLSGRRLRDINEEKRLKAWISQQADRERESEDRKKKRLEKLCQQPKHEFKDETYEKERSELTERVEDALLCGLSKDKTKRKPEVDDKITKKKPKLMFDASDEELSSSDENCASESDDETPKPGTSKSGLPDDKNENSNNSSSQSDDKQIESSNDIPSSSAPKNEEDK